MLKTALLPVGGKGTRMKGFSKIPKLLIKLNGKPLIDYTFEKLARYGIKKIFIISKEGNNVIENHCLEVCSKLRMELNVLTEFKLKGNFGGILENAINLPEEFIVVYPDLIWDCNLEKIYLHHLKSQSLITLVVRRTEHPEDSDTVKLCPLFNIKTLFSKVTRSKNITYEKNDLFGATGIYIMNKKYLLNSMNLKFDSDEIDLFESIEKNQEKSIVNISGYVTSEYIRDCGTPERFKKVSNEIISKKIYSRNYERAQKILFLDRDGTLIRNDKKIYLTSPEEVFLNEAILDIYKKYTSEGFLPVVVTNQPQIAHGKLSLNTLDRIHCKIQDLLTARNLEKIFQFLICPHHPHVGYKEEIPFLKFTCECRKPEIGMFNFLEKKFLIDLDQSLMIGDSKADEGFANNCGLRYLDVKILNNK
ncbi:HAD-IIIA family hydrolase [uncultured Prochlorococcus sp.]|uniref:HAD-IIIA family hydrolase n=1 Tax=uncultured Prochlorococcus sp. TaxID=159733 RepID=UPI00258FAF13|nr:HAD-IIIA family hydrolase [uncultured Prochlorococcus sp.]